MQISIPVLLSLLCLGLITSCASPKKTPSDREVALSPGDARVGTYTSNWKSFRTSSYWIEGRDGLIFIDTQFLPSAAEQMIEWAEQLTGKKVVLAIILHPNPDKFNGTSIFQKHGAKVITSDQVLSEIGSIHKLRTEWFYDRYAPDYPNTEPRPNSFGNSTIELKEAGINLKLHVLGRGCSEAHVVVEFENHVFVGDLVTQGFHSWLEFGYLNDWLNRLSEIKALKPKYVHMGRGGTGDSDSLPKEEEYLKTVIKIVEGHHPRKGQPLSRQEAEKILNEIVAKYPAYEITKFVENGLENVWKNLSK